MADTAQAEVPEPPEQSETPGQVAEPTEGGTNAEENNSESSASETSRPLSPRLDDTTTIKDVMSKLKRRGTALPMPSTVAKNQERRRKRLRGDTSETVSIAPTEAPLSPNIASSPPAPPPQPSPEPQEAMAPQVIIDEEGNIVVDQSSLFVETPRITTDTNAPVVEGSSERAHITSASFAKREKSMKWSSIDTEKFYLSLRAFGTDFSTMAKVFPYRSRKQLKLKYKREERENPHRIDAVLSRSEPTTTEQLDALFAQTEDGSRREAESIDNNQSGADNGNEENGSDGAGSGSNFIQVTRRSPSPEV